MEVKMEPIDEHGELMTLEDFLEHCEHHWLIDYDGFGYYATETEMTNIKVKPSHVKRGTIDNSWSHIVWFNR